MRVNPVLGRLAFITPKNILVSIALHLSPTHSYLKFTKISRLWLCPGLLEMLCGTSGSAGVPHKVIVCQTWVSTHHKDNMRQRHAIGLQEGHIVHLVKLQLLMPHYTQVVSGLLRLKGNPFNSGVCDWGWLNRGNWGWGCVGFWVIVQRSHICGNECFLGN